MSIVDVVVEIHRGLAAAGCAHAFGGALALAHHAEPRGTVDIDVNVFTDDGDGRVAIDALAVLGYELDSPDGSRLPIAGIRLRRSVDPFPVDLFPPLGPEYAEVAARVRWFPFGPDAVDLPFLSAEDLAVFKLSFGRDRDWVDLRSLCRAVPGLDAGYVERQLVSLRGPSMYPRIARLRSFLDAR